MKYLTSALVLLFVGCSLISNKSFDQEQLGLDVREKEKITLSDYTNFEWDRVYIFPPYSTVELINEELKEKAKLGPVVTDSYCLLVFKFKEDIIADFEIERVNGDFSKQDKKGGFTHEESVFEVIKDLENQWIYLDANKTLGENSEQLRSSESSS